MSTDPKVELQPELKAKLKVKLNSVPYWSNAIMNIKPKVNLPSQIDEIVTNSCRDTPTCNSCPLFNIIDCRIPPEIIKLESIFQEMRSTALLDMI